MRHFVDFLGTLLIISIAFGSYIYSDHIKFERCIKYEESHPEMFGDSCRNFYR